MSPLKMKLAAGLLAIACASPVGAQPPHAPVAPSQEEQDKAIRALRSRPVPKVNRAPDLRNVAHIERLFVGLKSRNDSNPNPKPMSKREQKRISEAAGVSLQYVRVAAGEWHIFSLPRLMIEKDAEEIAERIRKLPEVEYADPVDGGGPLAIPTDAVTPDDAQIVGLPRAMTRAEAWAIATKLSSRPDIERVEPIDPELDKRPPAKPSAKTNAGVRP